MNRRLASALPLSLAAALLSFSGCTSDNSDYHRQVQEIAKESAKKPTMVGEGFFADGKLDVEVRLGRGFRPRVKKALFEERNDPFGTGSSDKEERRYQSVADDEEYFIPRMHNSVLPPHALRLRVTNDSQAPMALAFLVCNSSLGNFVVRPEEVTLAPGQSHECEPMISLLGASGEDIPVKLTLSINGKVETQVVTLKLATSAPAPQKSS